MVVLDQPEPRRGLGQREGSEVVEERKKVTQRDGGLAAVERGEEDVEPPDEEEGASWGGKRFAFGQNLTLSFRVAVPMEGRKGLSILRQPLRRSSKKYLVAE